MAEEFEEKTLDSPLIVHKATDASYQETANDINIEITHDDTDDVATLERHRYRKVKKTKKWPYVLIGIVVAIVVLVCALYFSGVIKPAEKEGNSTESTSGYIDEVNQYNGIITVKGAYIFFEGTEVEGINGLVKEIKYLDEDSKFVLQDDHADSAFLSEEVIPTLVSYGIKYEVKVVVSSGLTSRYETTENAE